MFPQARIVLWWALLLLGVAATSCAKRELSEADMLAATLERLDRQWERRGAAPVRATWGQPMDMPPAIRAHPEVRWRLARGHVSRGLALLRVEDARRAFADARAEAMDCLMDDHEVATVRAVSGWPDAISVVPEVRQRCALWAGVAWTRWLELFGGAAGAIDLPLVTGLLHRAEAGAHADMVDLATWHMGILLALRPRHLGQDERSAARHLTDAYERSVASRDSDVWVRWCDLVRWNQSDGLPPPRYKPTTAEAVRAERSCALVQPGADSVTR